MSKKEKEVKKIKKKPTPKKTEKKKVVKTSWFRKLFNELEKVRWPDSKSVLKYSIATIVFVIMLGLFFELLNILGSLIRGAFN